MGKVVFSLIIVLMLVATACSHGSQETVHPLSTPPPSGWPTTWTGLDTDDNEGGCEDHRNVADVNGDGYSLYYATDSEYIYLRMETVTAPGWSTTAVQGKARYKWWFDTAGTTAYISGTSVYDAEFLLILEDRTDTSNVDGNRDRLGELTLMDDLANLGNTARWNQGDKGYYLTGIPKAGDPSTHWKREFGTGTPGVGGPQGVMAADIGYRIDNSTTGGNFTDMYISWAALGNPSSLCLIWATEDQNPNVDQAPNCDRPVQTSCLWICTPPEAAFNATPISGCAPLTVNFADQSTGNITSWNWTFGDGGTSTLQNPSHQYTSPGSYNVTLNVTTSCGSNGTTKTDYIVVNTKPTATASSNSPICEGATIQLSGGPNGMSSYSWTGPGGWTSSVQNPSRASASAAMSGTYTLTVTDSNGCTDDESTSVTVNVKPVATASSNLPVCEGSTIVLTGGPGGMTSYSWAGPNGFSSSLQNPTISSATSLNAGTYYLTVTDGGCTSDAASTVVAVNTKPVATASSNSPICEGGTIQLSGGPNGMSSYSWTGPGGWTSSVQNPSRASASAAMSGTYTLTVTDSNGCTDDESTSVTVNVKPTATASSNSPVCEGSTIVLTGGPGGMTSYSWAGPNGFSSSLQNPTISSATSLNAGTYYLTVTDGGCTSDAASTVVAVNTKPVATASSNSPICEGATIQLSGGPNGMSSYSWTGPGGWTSGVQNPSRASATAAMSGTYTLTVTDSNGCTDDESTSVTVNSKPTADAGTDAVISAGGSVVIGGTPTASGGTGPYSYSWSPSSGLSNASVDTPTASPTTNTTYTVTVTDSNGCTDSDAVTVTVTQGCCLGGFVYRAGTMEPLAGWEVILEKHVNPWVHWGSAITDANGKYLFCGLGEGEYRVFEVVQPGWSQVSPLPNQHIVTLPLSCCDPQTGPFLIFQNQQGGPFTVGWETSPVDKLAVLTPWIALFAAIFAGASLLVLRRRRE